MVSLATCLIGKTMNYVKQEFTDVAIFIFSFSA